MLYHASSLQVALRDLPRAEEAYEHALRLEPKDRLIRQKLTDLRQEKSSSQAAQTKLWGGLFNKS